MRGCGTACRHRPHFLGTYQSPGQAFRSATRQETDVMAAERQKNGESRCALKWDAAVQWYVR